MEAHTCAGLKAPRYTIVRWEGQTIGSHHGKVALKNLKEHHSEAVNIRGKPKVGLPGDLRGHPERSATRRLVDVRPAGRLVKELSATEVGDLA